MTDTTSALSIEQRRDILVRELKKYRGDGYAVDVSPDGLTATLTRRKRINPLVFVILAIFTLGIALIWFAFRAANRKTETVILRVDERGKIIRA
ncbi:hypothetical protein SEA_ZETA1847_48 [Microbacterium phage Zeta1847]|uniref:Uncharacterized protein n=1 Tax=Microbacterium phage Zeta1847 TaxID=2201444 RepID=A0A2Z4Q9D9_9CAUD|nr:hypothetical protein HOT46_gp48 [Microbacterium phage Zeta1847]AWY06682.1 hypothetical protein SEA_ZETA1847_48 [Microbacterium phage Zeta1847]